MLSPQHVLRCTLVRRHVHAPMTSAERDAWRAVQVPEGSVINSGDLIARLELDDLGAVTAAVPYPGGFPELGPPLVHSQGVDHRFKEAYAAAKMIMAGARRTRRLCDAVAALRAQRAVLRPVRVSSCLWELGGCWCTMCH